MPVITARSLSGETQWSRYIYGNNSTPSTATSGVGDIVPLQSDEYGALYTRPWVYNDYIHKTFDEIGEDITETEADIAAIEEEILLYDPVTCAAEIAALEATIVAYEEDIAGYEEDLEENRDWYMPLMSFDPVGCLAVDLPFYMHDGPLEAGALNIDGDVDATLNDYEDANGVPEFGSMAMEPYYGAYRAIEGDHYDATADTCTPITVVQETHHQIHDGQVYTATLLSAGVDDGKAINIYLKTPTPAEPQLPRLVHMVTRYSCNGGAYFRIYSGPTITIDTGTHVATLNRNKYSPGSSLCKDNDNPAAAGGHSTMVTKTVDGTIIYKEYTGAAKSLGLINREEEWLLNTASVYLFEVESDAPNETVGLDLTWYEHDTPFSA